MADLEGLLKRFRPERLVDFDFDVETAYLGRKPAFHFDKAHQPVLGQAVLVEHD